jgi:hypothetical protein
VSNTVYDPEGSARGLSDEPEVAVSSSLEDLRSAVEQAEQVAEIEFDDHELFGPGRIIKLVCSTELDQPELKRIQLAGFPPAQRKKRLPDPRKLDEGIVFATLIARLTTRIELLQDDGSYRAIEGDLTDAHVLAQLGVLDPVMAVKRIFGSKDAYLIRAGEELLNACGYGERKPGEPEDDDEDPT